MIYNKTMDKIPTDITYLGKSFKSSYGMSLSDTQYLGIKKEFYKKPDTELVNKQLIRIMAGKSVINHVIGFYIEHLMFDCKLSAARWSITEFMDSKELVSWAISKMSYFPKIYPIKDTIAIRLRTLFRIGSSVTAIKVSNFPIKTIQYILDTYNINDNYYDYSSGWSVRMMASMQRGINYYGTDANHLLVDKLIELSNKLSTMQNKQSTVDIRAARSEVLIPEYINKMGLSFSSPPYFDLEDYKHGKQSILNRDYNKWLESYWRKTVQNIYKYLIPAGYFLVNVKSSKKYDLLTDMNIIIEESGFEFVESFKMRNITRIVLLQNERSSDEVVMVYRKIH